MSVIFEKNGVVKSGGFSDTAPIQDMKIKTLDDNSVWARIHWLDVSETVEWFADSSEVAKCIDKSNRYSRMGIVDEFKTSDGVYEFMLTYPSLSDTDYYRWSQTSSPNSSTVTGYISISSPWEYCGYGIKRYVDDTCCMYHCENERWWFGAIGQYNYWSDTNDWCIPALNNSSQTSTELWVRIDTLPKQSQLKIYNNFISTKDFIEL